MERREKKKRKKENLSKNLPFDLDLMESNWGPHILPHLFLSKDKSWNWGDQQEICEVTTTSPGNNLIKDLSWLRLRGSLGALHAEYRAIVCFGSFHFWYSVFFLLSKYIQLVAAALKNNYI